MKNSILGFLGMFIIVVPGLSQTQQVSIPLNPGESISAVVETEDGLIIKKSDKRRDLALEFFSEDLKKVYAASIEDHKIKSNNIVSSPSGAFTYILDYTTPLTIFSKSTPSIVQVDKSGKVRRKDFEKGKSFHSKNALFADEEYFYILSSENGDQLTKKDKLEEKLVLHRIDHQNLEYKMHYVDAPAIKSRDHSFWSLAQVANQGFYIVSKTITDNQQEITLLKVNAEGQVTSENNITASLSNGFFRPGTSSAKTHSIHSINKWDFLRTTRQSGSGTVTVPIPKEGAFGGINVDRDKEEVYVFGLYGLEDYARLGSCTAGLFVHKFDQQSKLLWKLQQEAPEPLKADNWFSKLGRPIDCKSKFTVYQNGNSKYQVLLRDMVYTHDITSEGRLESAYNHKFEDWIDFGKEGLCFSSQDTHPVARYIAGKEDIIEKPWKYQAYHFRKGYVLLEEDKQEAKLLYFADPISMKK